MRGWVWSVDAVAHEIFRRSVDVGVCAAGEAPAECPLTLGPVARLLPAESNRSWYPFWFLASFLMDTAEALTDDFTAYVGADATQLEVHRLCMHALQIVAASPLHKYRLAPVTIALGRSVCMSAM